MLRRHTCGFSAASLWRQKAPSRIRHLLHRAGILRGDTFCNPADGLPLTLSARGSRYSTSVA